MIGPRLDRRRVAVLRELGVPLWVARDAAFDPGTPAPGAGRVCGDLDALRTAVAACTACDLAAGRGRTVFGAGPADAACMLIGEGPGAEEDRTGEPFVGRAGKLLDAMLRAIGLHRDQVFIANIVKCRPPANRDPRPEEVAACAGFLRAQIETIAPRVIVALGRVAAQNLLGSTQAIGRLRGQAHRHPDSGVPLVVTYHPAYLLRSPLEKRKSWDDLCRVRALLDGTAAEEPRS